VNFSHFKTGAPDSQPFYSKSEKNIAEIMLICLPHHCRPHQIIQFNEKVMD